MTSRTDVKILLVGEDGVGKTSLIMSLVCEEFLEEVPAKVEEITIPAEVTPERVPTHIRDFSFQEQSEEDLKEEILHADVICIVYAVDDESSIKKIEDFWMPTIHTAIGGDKSNATPILLVGNKSDQVEDSSMERVVQIMNQYSEIETCIQCSARTMKNISELFYYAQKAVLHPAAPLYVADKNELTNSCEVALKRVFKICDMDNDGLLNDRELNHFQKRCFNTRLQPEALDDIKAVIRKNFKNGLRNDSLTEKGFLFLHTMFIERGRHETTWAVLRKFGYDDDLNLSPEYTSASLKIPRGVSTELSEQGMRFLNQLFHKYDKDKDGCLNSTEIKDLFGTCPVMPWGSNVSNTISSTEQGWITHKGYIAQWVLTTFLHVHEALTYLAYLGYSYENDDLQSALHFTKDRRHDLRQKQTSRNVFHCNVVGPKGAGKTAFLQGHLKRNLKYLATINRDEIPPYTINTVQVYGQDKYLLLHEVDISQPMRPEDLTCDVVCLLYDVSDPYSFTSCIQMYKQNFHDRQIPCLVVTAKADQQGVTQESEFQPKMFCDRFKLPPPHLYSSIDQINEDVYTKLATMAAFPNWKENLANRGRLVGGAVLSLAFLAAAGFVLYRYSKHKTP